MTLQMSMDASCRIIRSPTIQSKTAIKDKKERDAISVIKKNLSTTGHTMMTKKFTNKNSISLKRLVCPNGGAQDAPKVEVIKSQLRVGVMKTLNIKVTSVN